jgi:predicted RNase H-like nuclease
MRFLGVDLAWSPRNTSAGAALCWDGDSANLVAWRDDLTDDADVVAWAIAQAGEAGTLVAIDAPLIVPNETGTRPCDREITRQFGRYHAGTHPANRRNLGRYEGLRGERLVDLLEQRGFAHVHRIERRGEVRGVMEVYPHPAMINLFGLDRILKYKARSGRGYEKRWAEFRRYQTYLRALSDSEPSVRLPSEITNRQVESLRGRALKRYEDLLDAVFCAYIALYCWAWGPMRYRIFGDTRTGYIVVPLAEAKKQTGEAIVNRPSPQTPAPTSPAIQGA